MRRGDVWGWRISRLIGCHVPEPATRMDGRDSVTAGRCGSESGRVGPRKTLRIEAQRYSAKWGHLNLAVTSTLRSLGSYGDVLRRSATEFVGNSPCFARRQGF